MNISPKMKIVYFNYMWDLWGACIGSTIKSLELLNALSKCGHDVKFYWRYDEFSRNSGPKSEEKNSSIRDKLKKYFGRYLHEPNQIVKNIRSMIEEPKILKEEKPDLIILDILLPRENGVYFLTKSKKHPEITKIPVVVFSNYDDPKTKKECFELGAKEYLIKTDYTPQQIIEKIKEYLQD